MRRHRMPQRVAEECEQDRAGNHADHRGPEIILEFDRRRAREQVQRVVRNDRHHPQIENDLESVARDFFQHLVKARADDALYERLPEPSPRAECDHRAHVGADERIHRTPSVPNARPPAIVITAPGTRNDGPTA